MINRQPVATAATVQAALAALIALLTAFDLWSPTQEQITAVMAFYVALTALLGVLVRNRVTPVVKLKEMLTEEEQA